MHKSHPVVNNWPEHETADVIIIFHSLDCFLLLTFFVAMVQCLDEKMQFFMIKILLETSSSRIVLINSCMVLINN